jgi:hypothetical protein
MQTVDRFGIFERLKHSIQLLACSSEIQLKMLPQFVCKADELALDFDNWREVALNFRSELTTHQLSCLDAIDSSLSKLTRTGPESWTEDAVRESGEWKAVRTLAAAALESFGWPLETPPSHADEFVRGPNC